MHQVSHVTLAEYQGAMVDRGNSEFGCVEGDDLRDVIRRLEVMNADGWEIASSHCAVNLDDTITHFIMIRRDREAD